MVQAAVVPLLFIRTLVQTYLDKTILIICGETGIRTPETLLEFTRFPGVPLQPLEHLSLVVSQLICACSIGTTHKDGAKLQKKIDTTIIWSHFFCFFLFFA